jgi:hypothetical protein
LFFAARLANLVQKRIIRFWLISSLPAGLLLYLFLSLQVLNLTGYYVYYKVFSLSSILDGNHILYESRYSSVGIALGYGLDDQGYRVRFPAGVGNFSLHHCVQNGSGAYPASYPMGTRSFSPGGKATGALI